MYVHSFSTVGQKKLWGLVYPAYSIQLLITNSYDSITGRRTEESDLLKMVPFVPIYYRSAKRTYQKIEGYSGDYLVEEVIGPLEPYPLITSYSYYTDRTFPAGVTTLPIRKIVYPNGNWERRDYDTKGRITLRIQCVGNNDSESAENLNRSTHYSYAPIPNSGDIALSTGSENAYEFTAREEIDYFQGTAVGRRFRIIKAGEQREIVAQRRNAEWYDTDNLVTLTKFPAVTEGSFKTTERRPDGTLQILSYAPNAHGGRTYTIEEGEANTQNLSEKSDCFGS